MPRTVRDARLETASARARLERERLHWCGIAPGLALGYRAARSGFGSWYARVLTDRAEGTYSTRRIGAADDHTAADGLATLDFWQARDKVIRQARPAEAAASGGELAGAYTVADAAREYLEWFRHERKSYTATKTVIDAHVLPRLGRRPLAELTQKEIKSWHRALATTPARVRAKRDAKRIAHRPQDLADPDVTRRRRATANRVLSVLRALLNHAWREGHVASDTAWRRVRPFRNASEPLVRYLELAEATRLVNASQGDLRALVRGALLTGCRYGELVAMRVEHFRRDAGSVYVAESKSGRPRHVPLSAEGLGVLEELTAGRAGAELLFTRAGTPWGKNDQVRGLAAACARAQIAPAVSFHVLRHTYASWLVSRGVTLQVVAELLGHSDTRITQKHYGHLAPRYVAEMVRKNLPGIAPARGKVKALVPRNARSGAPDALNARRA